MRRHIVFWAYFLMIILSVEAQKKVYIDHVIQAGETLYSLARANGVTVDELRAANPQLGETYQAGQTIKIPTIEVVIPQCKQTYKVGKKETLYSISKQFGLTIDELKAANPLIEGDKIKKNTELCIPYSTLEVSQMKAAAKPKPDIVMPKELKVAVILPYGLDSEKKDKEACTMIDFYEGFLLAVQEQKRNGISVELHAYDEADIADILQKPEMQTMNMIVGPKDIANITRVTNFCQRWGITHVVPLSSVDNIVDSAPWVFQVNSKVSTRSSKIFREFVSRYSDYNIIFATVDNQSNQSTMANNLKNYLTRNGIKYRQVELAEIDTDSTLFSTMSKNVVVPLSSSQLGFENLIKKLDNVAVSSDHITLFGWHEWQTFAPQFEHQFAMYHCSFFAPFFCNPSNYETVAFSSLFKNRFGRSQYATFPRFGTLGYDVGTFFIKHAYEQGNKFTEKVTRLTSKAIQNPLSFIKKEDGSGFINNSLMLVEYKSNGKVSITKL